MPKSMLISGASTGIGKALSLELDRQGYQVFAGVRNSNDADVRRSQASPQLTPVILDVTIPETISTTCRELSEKTGGELFCLVNNAGISISGALEFMPLQDFRQQMEVNLVGQLALTQACLPMLRRAAGRVVFVSSVSGRLATPFNGPYAASKAALVALRNLRRIDLHEVEARRQGFLVRIPERQHVGVRLVALLFHRELPLAHQVGFPRAEIPP